MDPIIKTKNLELSDYLRQYIEKKLDKLDRILPRDTECRVELSVTKAKSAKDRQVVQITVSGKDVLLRAEDRSADMRTAVDSVVDKLYRQVRRYKGKRYQNRVRPEAPEIEPDYEAEEEESGPTIVRVKRFPVTPMTGEEAVEQMELLGHDFFIFHNTDTQAMGVVYRRRDGNYGLLEPALV